VDNPRFGRPERYTGELRLIEKEFSVKYDKFTLTKNVGMYPGVVFIENTSDLFAESMPMNFIQRVLGHCREWPENTYVFQTKNPERYIDYMDMLPKNVILGCTIETNRDIPEVSSAPRPLLRCSAMAALDGRRFITIEPVLDFDVEEFADWIVTIDPEFVNIGADSKGHGLFEPPIWKVDALVDALMESGIEIREKHNLERLREAHA
jgi:protein gp37